MSQSRATNLERKGHSHGYPIHTCPFEHYTLLHYALHCTLHLTPGQLPLAVTQPSVAICDRRASKSPSSLSVFCFLLTTNRICRYQVQLSVGLGCRFDAKSLSPSGSQSQSSNPSPRPKTRVSEKSTAVEGVRPSRLVSHALRSGTQNFIVVESRPDHKPAMSTLLRHVRARHLNIEGSRVRHRPKPCIHRRLQTFARPGIDMGRGKLPRSAPRLAYPSCTTTQRKLVLRPAA